MLCAVPPSMVLTKTVEWEGSKRSSRSRAAMSSPMRSSSAIRAAAAAMALTPSSGMLERAARPARRVFAEQGDQGPDADAANLFVIGDDDVDRLLQVPRLEGRHRGEHAGDE